QQALSRCGRTWNSPDASVRICWRFEYGINLKSRSDRRLTVRNSFQRKRLGFKVVHNASDIAPKRYGATA
ncbi:hypothetical protein, partial [Burkholderia sp. LMG 13014]|uniref:hypothetical protein n=1 Tax=Burkholderia sp. LMG 13014 TaxID=2709306 RepID=UPI001963D7EC